MSLEAHHKFMLDMVARQDAIARKFIAELENENARLKAEVERLKVAEDAVKAYHEDDVNGFLTLCAIWHAAKGVQS